MPLTIKPDTASRISTLASKNASLRLYEPITSRAAAATSLAFTVFPRGARGCVIQVTPPQLNALADLYVVIVWQGITKRADPLPDSAAGQCASDVDFGAGLRRGVSVRVLVPDLHKSS